MGGRRQRWPMRFAARVALVGALVWAEPALAAVPFALPAGESVAEWTVPLGLAGFTAGAAGSGARVRVTAAGARWTVEVTDERGGVHVVTVDRPTTARAREDLVWLAQSLVHPAPSLLSALPATLPAAAPSPAAPSPAAPSPAAPAPASTAAPSPAASRPPPAAARPPVRTPTPPTVGTTVRAAPPATTPPATTPSTTTPAATAPAGPLASPAKAPAAPAPAPSPTASPASPEPAPAAAITGGGSPVDTPPPAVTTPAAASPVRTSPAGAADATPAAGSAAPTPAAPGAAAPTPADPAVASSPSTGTATPPPAAAAAPAALPAADPDLTASLDTPADPRALARLDVRWWPEVGAGGGVALRPGAPVAGDASLRVAARRTGGLGVVAVVEGPGRSVPDVLVGKGTLWGGFAGLGAGWMSDAGVSAGLEGGVGASAHYLAYAADLGFDPSTSGLSVSPALWVAPRIAAGLVGPLLLTLDARAGVDLYEIAFYVYDADTGEASGRGSLSRGWAAPTIALSWSP